MKKILFIIICIIGFISFSSCRSTSKPCGLAENSTMKVEWQNANSDILKV